MKIDRIQLHGFLSHTDTDWNPNGARLVSLVGANGAGKSSLLDAIAYALFDAARGKTDDLVQLGATDMSVVVEFEYSGAHYRVARGRTTKAGGRSFLELHVQQPDGTWRPLTLPTIRETQGAIDELLRVDSDTFRTAVLLMQGRANQFAEATAAERKRILSTVLGLDVYGRAEAEARQRSIELVAEGRSQQERAQRIDDAMAELSSAPEALQRRGDDVRRLEAEITETNEARAAADLRLQELAASLAAGEAAEADVARLQGEIDALKDRYRRAQERQASAQRMAEFSATTLAGAAAVDEAIERVPALQAEVERLEAIEAEAFHLDERIRVAKEAHQAASAAEDAEHRLWTQSYEATRRQVDELAVAVQQLAPVVCEACGHETVVDQAGLREKLKAARRAFALLEANQPKPSTSLARDAAAIVRLEERRRAIADVRSQLATARGELSGAQSRAARADAIAQARLTAQQAASDEEAAAKDIATITAAGTAARDGLTVAQARVAELAGLRAERTAVTERLVAATKRLPELGREHTAAIAAVAQLRANVDRLEALKAERSDLATAIETTSAEASLMKRLVQAFAVTGIPARIIEGVLPELTAYAGELLAELRPGMTLAIQAQRAKKDGKGVIESLDLVVRDAAGERPLALFSGGERMSVSLALAVGLSRLVARRAGTALRTLVIDEPDGLDADARRAFGTALRVLAHHGELARVVLVSHHEDLAEAADEIYRVTKNGHGSVVELVA